MHTEQAAAELVWDTRCETGESPVWDAATGRLWFVDIPGRRIHCLETHTSDTRGDARTHHDLPDVVPCIGLCRSGRLVVAQRHHVALFDPRSGVLTRLTEDVDQPASNRFNDGKVGPDGCLWVGSMDERHEKEPVASLFRVTPDGAVQKKLDGLHVSNGLAWSPDGRIMYLSDTVKPAIDAFDFDPITGCIGKPRRIATPDESLGQPDGGATDIDGCYWSAGVTAGCLNRFSPAGQLLQRVFLPVPTPTMPCFAEDQLYVTSLREGCSPDQLARYPTMGGLFRLPAPLRGAPVGIFAD